jgi:hypothetical protein
MARRGEASARVAAGKRRASDGVFAPDDPTAEPEKKGRGFQKGHSGNPGGVPKSVKAIRDLIGALTNNGEELVELAVSAMRGEKEADGLSREYAHQWLSDRYYGKPKQSLDVSIGITPDQAAAIAALKLSPHERRQKIEELRARAERPALPPAVIVIPDDADPD